eukprot:TRINITY_DN24113_c0_g1_i1.p1 TRINITY_DN24113_c0_g1~~TRINITY_DN24113_c0_g1_i1.p1  ORF type:complete len:310 (-),score=80.49 TRINITY_DN24113_c0_g1_i1:110-1018(-)
MSIPTSHPGGQDLTLSCDYSYTLPESDQLVLTWYHNGSPIPIYQWVPALDMGPQVIHQLFKDNLDLTYEAHEDKFKKHSALRIINPDQRFTGNYKCRVSTFLEEVSEDKDVFIYVPPTSIALTITEGVISCQVEAVYPQPQVILAWTVNSTAYSSNQMELTANPLKSKLFDASVAATIEEADFAPHDMVTCEVMIDGTDYDKRVEKNILEKIESSVEPDQKVQLVEELCNSADCFLLEKNAADDENPVDYEAVDKTIVIGTGIETFSEEAAKFVSSSTSLLLGNIILVLLISALIMQSSLFL